MKKLEPLLFPAVTFLVLLAPLRCHAEPRQGAMSQVQGRARLQMQTGHSDAVTSVSWSPDDRTLATASEDKTVRLWDVETGKELRVMLDTDRVPLVSWNPDGRRLATINRDGKARVWDSTTGKELYQLGHAANSVAWSPDGRSLASAGERATALWDASTGKEVRQLVGHTSGVHAIYWSPNGRHLITSGRDNTARIWDAALGKELHRLKREAPSFWHHATDLSSWSADGRVVATLSEDHSLQLWDTNTGKEMRRIIDVSTASYSPNDRLLATGGNGDNVKIWDPTTGRLLVDIPRDPARPIEGLSWRPDGRTLATVDGNEVRLWDPATGKQRGKIRSQSHSVMWSHDGRTLATIGRDNVVRLWDPGSGKELLVLAGHTHPLQSVAWSTRGSLLATAGDDRGVRLWEAAAGKQLRTLETSAKAGLAWSPDGHTLAVGNEDRTVQLWEATTGKRLHVLDHVWDGHGKGLARLDRGISLSWSPNGCKLATIRGGTAWIWDTATGSKQHILEGRSEFTGSASWSPDSSTVALCRVDGAALWDAAQGRELQVLEGRGDLFSPDGFRSTHWSPDGLNLDTETSTSHAVLWDARTGKESRRLTNLSSVSWSPGGLILAAERGGSTRLLDASSGKERYALSATSPLTMQDNLSWSPDGQTLAKVGEVDGSGFSDDCVSLWNVVTGKRQHLLKGHSGAVRSLSWSPDSRALATASFDCTTRIWDTPTGAELAALVSFPHGDWAVVSPEGFFDGSMRGLKEIHWVIGRNPQDLEQFFNEFYQPGLLKDVLEKHKPISEILRDRKDPRASLTILKKDRRPCRVNFGSIPAPGKPCNQRKLNLTLNVQESGPDATHKTPCGIKDVRVFNNGILVWRSPSGQPVKPGSISLSVPIVAGKNSLSAYAFNQDNVKCRDVTAEVTGAKSLERQGQAWILTIGIDKYADHRYDLNYAGADAKELAKALHDTLPFPDRDKNVHVTTLLDGQATRKGILEALRAIAKRALPEDTVIVTYAGHGMNHKGRFSLLPHDLGPARDDEELVRYGVSDIDLEEIFIGMQAGHITLVLDACHSGQALESEEWRTGPMNSRGLSQLAWEKGMDILTASQSNETAKEVSKLGHGLLTYALLKCFEDDSLRQEGQLPARKWLDYGAAEVPQLLENDGDVKQKTPRSTKRHLQGDRRVQLIQTPRVFHAHEDTPDWMVSGPPQGPSGK